MKVELNLSDEVYAYIEYIPKEKLSDILSGLLAEAIKGKSSEKASTEDLRSSSAAISEVMTLLRQMASGQNVQQTEEPVKETIKKKKPPKKVITLEPELDGDLDDDFLAMLK